MGRVVTRSQRLKLLTSCNDDSNSKRCKVISKVLLPQDLLLHILTLLPLKSLINSARYVCKSWATTIRTSQFALACLTHSKPGLFVQNHQHRTAYFLDIKDCVNGQFEFERTGMVTILGKVVIYDSCNGILLLLLPNERLKQIQPCLVNPITKSCFRTPPLPRTPQRPFRLFFESTLVCVPYTAKFKLFFLDIQDVSGVDYYVFYVLTIGIGNSWREIDRKKVPYGGSYWQPLYGGGNYLYWITGGDHAVTVVDVDKEITAGKFSLPPVPMYCAVEDVETFFTNMNTKFLWMGNQLSCIVIKDFKTFKIYLLDFESGKWSLYHDMGHFDCVAASGHEFIICDICCWIHDQIIFSLFSKERKRHLDRIINNLHFSYSVKTRKLTKIEGISMGDQI
ncbi:uncharacterized protein LOC131630471 isoform X2 [Vicia villosa]|uniref:uncharacterized protein LOC131630471 isoform X2 n=1 Tax=Vicia villosa TaxID=3911 RepID=UPI00273B5708|nr:uncharacterized protein LOC131630471 isoform X2 [Vicia villosa]